MSARRGPRLPHADGLQRLAGLRVIHPLPSALNAGLVAALALVAGAAPVTALALATAMLGFQASIGALNDVVDADRDGLVQPSKPIPAGLISARAAAAIAIVGGGLGLVVSATFGLHVLALAVAGYGSGIAYDLFMRRAGLGWLCFTVAFPLLLTWTWMAAARSLPPAWQVLLPLAALAGPTVHLANSLVDVEADQRAGVRTMATWLGSKRAIPVLAALVVTVHALAWLTLAALGELDAVIVAATATATLMAAVGVVLSARSTPGRREMGWLLQAAAVAVLGVAWVAAVALT